MKLKKIDAEILCLHGDKSLGQNSILIEERNIVTSALRVWCKANMAALTMVHLRKVASCTKL